jgi:mxaC protein
VTLWVDHAWVLCLLGLCLPALFGRDATWNTVSSLMAVPEDRWSVWLDRGLRLVAAGVVAVIVLGLAGLHRGASEVARIGHGAHVVLVLDRSLSMDEGFARTGEKARTTKTKAAASLIEAFFAKRTQDSFGLVAFSTNPILVMPLTEHRAAMAGAMAAMAQKGLANTDIGAGLEMALGLFARDDPHSARVILFVSDGAGRIPAATQARIRIEALTERVHIYYLYLRSGDAPALAADLAGSNDPTTPASLDAFFRSLDIAYRGFEASDPGAVEAATRAIGQLETRPVTYHETMPRIDERGLCYGLACAGLLILLLARLAERGFIIAGEG